MNGILSVVKRCSFWHVLKIRHKVFTLFILLSLTVLCLVSIPTYLFFRNRAAENSQVYSVNTAAQFKTSVLLLTRLLENNISEQIKRSLNTKTEYRTLQDLGDNLILKIEIEKLMLNLLYPFIGFNEIYFLSNDGDGYQKNSRYADLEDSRNPMYQSLRENEELIYEYWGDGLWFSHNAAPETVFIARAVYLNYTMEPVGILACGVSLEYIEEFFSGYDVLRGGDIFVFNRENQLVYSNNQFADQSVTALLIGNLERGRTESGVLSAGVNNFLVNWFSFNDMRLHISHVTSLDKLFGDVRIMRIFMLTASLLTLALAFSASYYFASSITNRLSLLVDRIHYIERGHREARVVDLGRDEIGELGCAFNSMTESLERNINKLAQQEIKVIKAEYTALQSYMNPHFLFNVLESINSTAKLRGEEGISRIVSLLAGLLRTNVRTVEEKITLREERTYVQNYLDLYQTILGGKFSVEWDVEEGLECKKIPKFILQPLVENAVKHGLEGVNHDGIIMISVQISQDKDFLHLEVSDNGAGISRAVLEDLRVQIRHDNAKERHIGLSGTYRRLKLLYGDVSKMEIRAEEGIGTSILLVIPLESMRKCDDQYFISG